VFGNITDLEVSATVSKPQFKITLL
jgi:hypothetical protein